MPASLPDFDLNPPFSFVRTRIIPVTVISSPGHTESTKSSVKSTSMVFGIWPLTVCTDSCRRIVWYGSVRVYGEFCSITKWLRAWHPPPLHDVGTTQMAASVCRMACSVLHFGQRKAIHDDLNAGGLTRTIVPRTDIKWLYISCFNALKLTIGLWPWIRARIGNNDNFVRFSLSDAWLGAVGGKSFWMHWWAAKPAHINVSLTHEFKSDRKFGKFRRNCSSFCKRCNGNGNDKHWRISLSL